MESKSGAQRNTSNDELRCSACGVLLGKLEGGALSIRRGDLQATIDGEFHASLVCYRPRCRKLNVFMLPMVRAAPEQQPR